MKQVLTFTNYKGGVGKTTSCLNVGAALAKKGKKVLLIDLDPQFNLTSSLKVEASDFTTYEALTKKEQITPVEVTKKLFLIPSSFELIKAEIELSTAFKREFILSEYLNSFYKADFDYILIDCPPSLGLLTINAIIAADAIFTPIAAEFLSLKGFSILNQAIEGLGKQIDKVFITRFDSRKILNKNILEQVNNSLKDRAFKTFIRENVSIAEAPAAGVDIISYKKNSTGAIDYKNLTKEIINFTTL